MMLRCTSSVPPAIDDDCTRSAICWNSAAGGSVVAHQRAVRAEQRQARGRAPRRPSSADSSFAGRHLGSRHARPFAAAARIRSVDIRCASDSEYIGRQPAHGGPGQRPGPARGQVHHGSSPMPAVIAAWLLALAAARRPPAAPRSPVEDPSFSPGAADRRHAGPPAADALALEGQRRRPRPSSRCSPSRRRASFDTTASEKNTSLNVRAAVHLLERSDLDAGLVHVDDEVRDARGASAGRRRCGRRASRGRPPAAPDVHTFWPLTIHTSPSRTARVDSDARSDPAPGSLKSWHHDSSAGRQPVGTHWSCCSSVPCSSTTGPPIIWPRPPGAPTAPAAARAPRRSRGRRPVEAADAALALRPSSGRRSRRRPAAPTTSRSVSSGLHASATQARASSTTSMRRGYSIG